MVEKYSAKSSKNIPELSPKKKKPGVAPRLFPRERKLYAINSDYKDSNSFDITKEKGLDLLLEPPDLFLDCKQLA